MLNGCGAERVADLRKHRAAFGARIAEHANLDQFVRVQIDIDFVQHCRRKAVLANADDRMQVMRFGAKRAALRG